AAAGKKRHEAVFADLQPVAEPRGGYGGGRPAAFAGELVELGAEMMAQNRSERDQVRPTIHDDRAVNAGNAFEDGGREVEHRLAPQQIVEWRFGSRPRR